MRVRARLLNTLGPREGYCLQYTVIMYICCVVQLQLAAISAIFLSLSLSGDAQRNVCEILMLCIFLMPNLKMRATMFCEF